MPGIYAGARPAQLTGFLMRAAALAGRLRGGAVSALQPLICFFSPPDDVALDPLRGSGNTLVAVATSALSSNRGTRNSPVLDSLLSNARTRRTAHPLWAAPFFCPVLSRPVVRDGAPRIWAKS